VNGRNCRGPCRRGDDIATARGRRRRKSPASQIVAVALRTLLNLSPSARRALHAIDGVAEGPERDFAGQLAGRADILVTADLDDFIRGPAIRLQRPDVALFPFADTTLVVAKPSFAAHWLRQGVVPDAAFIAARPAAFPRAADARDIPG
jgi:hypothetical protein